MSDGNRRPVVSGMGDEMQPATEAEGASLDLVQRTVVSVLIGAVMVLLAGGLGLYVALTDPSQLARGDAIGLWIVSGVLGLVTAGAILIINRRRPYHPAVLVGLIPMAVTAYWLFRY